MDIWEAVKCEHNSKLISIFTKIVRDLPHCAFEWIHANL